MVELRVVMREVVSSTPAGVVIPSMFIYDHCGTLKNPHTIRKRAGHEVPGVVAGFCESFGMGGY